MKMKVVIAGLLLISSVLSYAQQTNKEVININQRIWQHRPQNIDEGVDSFHHLHLMIGGNVYQTEQHVNYAYDKDAGKYDFSTEFKYVQPLLNLGDISIVNLKTSFGDNSGDMFSSPDEFALTLKYAGITAVMHANMHTANVDKATLKRTRDVLNKYDMYHAGAYIDQIERNGNFPLIIDKKGFRVAILNYTKLPSRPQESRGFFINELDKTTLERDMRFAHAYKPDFTIVYFDWSDNFQGTPNPTQQQMAKFAFEKGADLVVGTCPNAPQRIDYVNYFFEGNDREGIVAYSLGNLVSSNSEIKNRDGFLIDMEIQKNIFTNTTKIDDWGVIPVYTYYDTVSTPGKTKVFSVPCWAIESGDIFPNIPYIEKRRVVNSAYTIRQLLGANADEVQYNLNELIVNNVKETIEITSASLNNKYSMARASDLKPSAAPTVPAADSDPKKVASLAKVYEETSAPTLAITAKPDTAKKKTAPTVAIKPVAPASGQIVSFGQPETDNSKIAAATSNTDTVYRIQFYALKTYTALDTNYYTHLKGYEAIEENGMYKYYLGKFKNFDECSIFWHEQIQPRYKQSFIVKFVNGKRALK